MKKPPQYEYTAILNKMYSIDFSILYSILRLDYQLHREIVEMDFINTSFIDSTIGNDVYEKSNWDLFYESCIYQN